VLIAIDAQHAMSQARQTGRRHASDVTQAEHGNLRWIFRVQCP
jgi:hypothetical protein